MAHTTHEDHVHVHGENCGHTRIQHGDHTDFLHNGHLHAAHDSHYDECVLEVSDANPADCAETACSCNHDDCEHEQVPHGDHVDYLVDGKLHHRHNGHCDDHGAVYVM
jgi:hypothetical protein